MLSLYTLLPYKMLFEKDSVLTLIFPVFFLQRYCYPPLFNVTPDPKLPFMNILSGKSNSAALCSQILLLKKLTQITGTFRKLFVMFDKVFSDPFNVSSVNRAAMDTIPHSLNVSKLKEVKYLRNFDHIFSNI